MTNWQEVIQDTGSIDKIVNSKKTWNWDLTEDDWDRGRAAYALELHDSITDQRVFESIIYSILSIGQAYDTHMHIYTNLKSHELITPEQIIKDKETKVLELLLKKGRFPNRKPGWIYELAERWEELDFTKLLQDNLGKSRDDQVAVRKKIITDVKGLQLKTASLLMIQCGYTQVVPVDVWIARYCDDMLEGVKVDWTYYKERGGLRPKDIRACESAFVKKAEEYGATPALFNYVIWKKNAKAFPAADAAQGRIENY